MQAMTGIVHVLPCLVMILGQKGVAKMLLSMKSVWMEMTLTVVLQSYVLFVEYLALFVSIHLI